jgi:hypothetical protein
MAVLRAAIPHFLVRLTAVCVERRDIGMLREFILRAVASGIGGSTDVAGFLGVPQPEVNAEVAQLADELFIRPAGPSTQLELLEKGRVALTKNGLPQVVIRETAVRFNGVTRRIEQAVNDLVPRRRLLANTLVLPAVPARAPRIGELDLASVKFAMTSNQMGLSRLLEVARLGRIVRATNLFQSSHLLLRRGVHSVPTICVDGAANSDLARELGAHPALQNLKGQLERAEKQVRHLLLQQFPGLRGRGTIGAAIFRSTLTSFVSWVDAENDAQAPSRQVFARTVESALNDHHWISRQESQVLLAYALVRAKRKLIVVAPPTSHLLGPDLLEELDDAARRGTTVELHVPAAQARAADQSDDLRASMKHVTLVEMLASSDWCGFCCDGEFAVVGSNRLISCSMGKVNVFFGAVVVGDGQAEQLLRAVAIDSGAPVTVKVRRRIPLPPAK